MPDGSVELKRCAIDLNNVTTNIQHLTMAFINNLGQIGNNIFIICSAWFLLDSKTTKSKKIAQMIGDCFIISVIMLVSFSVAGYIFSKTYLFKQLFPVTMGNNWFVTYYLILYAIHPLLNHIITSMKKRQLLLFDIVFILLYCVARFIISFIMSEGVFFYSNIIGFVGIYFIVAYIKMYLTKTIHKKHIGIWLVAIGIIGWLAQNILTNYLGLHIAMFSKRLQNWNGFTNLFFILIALGAFIIANKYKFHNKHINYFSGLSLLIYIIRANTIIRDYVRFDVFEYILDTFSYDNLLLWVGVFAAISLICATIITMIYHATLQKFIRKVSYKLADTLAAIYSKFEEKVLRLN